MFNVFGGRQVLDGCQFLHHRGIVHLNLQPDSVIMVSRRRFDVKLVDFGRSRKITSYDGEPVPREGMAEFMGTTAFVFSLWRQSATRRHI